MYLIQDIRIGCRVLLKSPGFAAVVVITLSLGIGGSTAIFSVVNAVLVRPLPYADPDQLVVIWNDLGDKHTGQSFPLVSAPDFLDYREQSRLIADFAAASPGSMTLTARGDPIQIEEGEITANFFPLLGVVPELGRHFLPRENIPNGLDVAILSHSLWQRQFAGNPDVIGRTIVLNDADYLIVGVMPAEFQLLLPPETWGLNCPDVWTPMQEDFANEHRNLQSLLVLGRMAPGVDLAQAQAEMDVIGKRLRDTHAVHETARLRIRVVPLHHDVVKDMRSSLLLLLVAVGFVLLIVCANIANLFLARASTRHKELAVRIALGAPKATLFRQAITESVILSSVGGALGILLVPWALTLLLAIKPTDLPRLEQAQVDGSVLLFALCTTLLTGVLVGLAPALRSIRSNAFEVLRHNAGWSNAPVARGLRNHLIIMEIAVSVVLLIGTGLLLRSFISLGRVQPGFDADRIMTFRLDLPSSRYPNRTSELAFYNELEEQIAGLPGVEAAGLITHLPLDGTGPVWPYAYDEETEQNWEMVTADWRRVSPDYFRALGTRLVAGRFFTPEDHEHGTPVLIVDETLAQQAWPNEDPVGQRLKVSYPVNFEPLEIGRVWLEVVGVVEHIHNHDLRRQVRPQFYHSFRQLPDDDMSVVVRASVDPSSLGKALRGVVRSMDPALPVYNMQPMQRNVDNALASHRFVVVLIAIFGTVALFLAALGTYGVISFAVGRQFHEFGIRMALGAQSRHIFKQVVGRGLLLVTTGVVLGLVGSLAITRLLTSLLYEVESTDPLTYVVVSLILVATGLLACFIPARRAALITPLTAIRCE